MKVIELLLQGKKVWDKKHTGYYELGKHDNNPVLVYKDKETDKVINKYYSIGLDIAFREGEEYTKPRAKYIVTYKGYMMALRNNPSQVIECINVDKCIIKPNNCKDCPFSSRNGGVNLNDCKIHKIEY